MEVDSGSQRPWARKMLPIGKTSKQGKRVILPSPFPAPPPVPRGLFPCSAGVGAVAGAARGSPAAVSTLPRRDRAAGETQSRAGAAASGRSFAAVPGRARLRAGPWPQCTGPPFPPPRCPAWRLSWGTAAKLAQPANGAC